MASKFFEYWGWEDLWACLAFAATIVLTVLAVVALCADHRVRYYYVSQDGGQFPCVMAGVNWTGDKRAFCSDDISKVQEMLKRLNEELRNGVGPK